jgi:hypothetical protein
MSTLTYPNSIQPNTLEDANAVMGNFNAILAVLNGNVQAAINAAVAAPVAQPSLAIAAGSSSSLARADHAHVIQSFEQLTADPASGNFVGRCYNNTSTLKIRMCINVGGSGTWITLGNVSATELVNHAPQHISGGDDQLSGATVRLQNGSAQTIGTGASPTALTWPTESWDNDAMHEPVTNPTRITFTHAGVYYIFGAIAYAASGTGDRWASIQTNGSGNIIAHVHTSGPSAGDNPGLNPSCIYKAGAAEYVELFTAQTSGGNLNVLANGGAMVGGARSAPQYFGAHWLGMGT